MLRGIKLICLLFAVVFLASIPKLDAQPGTWAVSIGSNLQDYPEDILTDNQGNSYITGYFRDTLNVASSQLVSAGKTDIFLAKYDAAGQMQWTQRVGWLENEFSHAMAFDTAGNIILVGEYQDSIILGNDTILSLDTLWYGPYSGTYDVLVLTFDPSNGNLLDYRAAGWFGSENFYDVQVDSRNFIFFSGMFRTFNNFGGGLWGRGYDDAFLVSMDTGGVFNWKAVASGRYIDRAYALDLIGDSLWIMAGDFQDTCYFRDSSIYSVTNFEDNVFVSCWDSTFGFRWKVTGGGPGKDHLSAMVSNSVGDLFICGRYDTAFSLGGFNLVSEGELDGFLAKISKNGTVQWLKSIGGTRFDDAIDLEIGDDDRVLLTGYFQGEADFDGTLVSAADSLDQDIFVASYDPSGNLLWVRRAGGMSVDKGTCIDVDAQGHVYVAGAYSARAYFGSQRLNSLGSEDIFLMRMLPDGSVDRDPMAEPLPLATTVWPNPADQILNFNLEVDKGGKGIFRMMDLNGRLVGNDNPEIGLRPGSNQFSISTEGLAPGMYLYEIQVGNQRQSGKVAIAH